MEWFSNIWREVRGNALWDTIKALLIVPVLSFIGYLYYQIPFLMFIAIISLLILATIFLIFTLKGRDQTSEIVSVVPTDIEKPNVEIVFKKTELYISEPNNHIANSNDTILRILVINQKNSSLRLRAYIDIESRVFERLPLTFDKHKQQTDFTLFAGDKKFVNLLEYRKHNPNEIKFHSTTDNYKKSIVPIKFGEKLTITFMVLGDNIKPHQKNFDIFVDKNGLQFG